MATTGIGFRWLDILEKEFDKACVELDTSLVDLNQDEEVAVFNARQKVATLSSCFAQLTHKALSIFQNSAKLEAELVDMRAELVQARAACAGAGQDGGDVPGNVLEAAHARAEAAQLARENASLRETVLALHSELFGARLATKYLDKELAGRIQQLQLLGRDMRAELRDSLWAQVEAEILLQRHKTLVRVCRGLAPRPPRPPRDPRPPRPRTVRVKRSPHLGLGISVTGGREHGVPVLISELEAGGPAALTGQLYVGDAILAIDDVDLTQACHKEAVQALQSVKGDCELCVQFIATDDDDHLSEDHYRFPLYPEDGEVFGGEQDGSGATPTAPRTPDYNNRARSEVNSGSECESPRYAEVPYRPPDLPYRPPQASYPDYNALNNNLSILDMDDDSIKIEAPAEPLPPETPPASPVFVRERSRHRQRGQYRGLPAETSSNDSPHSTPVHGRRPSLKKKRVKPGDWRSKGTYKAIDDEVHSSDDIRAESPVNGHGISTVFDKPPPEPSPVRIVTLNEDSSPKSQESMISDLTPPQTELVQISSSQTVQNQSKSNQIASNSIPQPLVPLPPPQEVVIPPLVKAKLPNGVDKGGKSKAFRIGSAKRVLDTAPLPNGNAHHVEKYKYPAQLVGDGDPDFGTPV